MTIAQDVEAFLIAHGLATSADAITLDPLAGGVSSDIWRVTVGTREFCVKRALGRLRTARLWEVPTARNESEWAWLELVAGLLPSAVPKLYAHDPNAGMFAMEYLAPQSHPIWKNLLRDGMSSLETAREVGDRLGFIHATTANDAAIAVRFANDALFFSLRLEPYLLATARAHADLGERLRALAQTTAETQRVLVHGDVSPKNILIGPDGPIFLDAECAWYGDPAFDLAFLLNHLLLKSVWRPQFAGDYAEAFIAATAAYLSHVDWESVEGLERRCAQLLPALTLARVDGTSPVEYLTDERDKETVRAAALSLLRSGPSSLSGILNRWMQSAVPAV